LKWHWLIFTSLADSNGHLIFTGKEWAVLALGHAGTISVIEIDTHHFKGELYIVLKISFQLFNAARYFFYITFLCKKNSKLNINLTLFQETSPINVILRVVWLVNPVRKNNWWMLKESLGKKFFQRKNCFHTSLIIFQDLTWFLIMVP